MSPKRTVMALKACVIGALLGTAGTTHADVLLADWTDDEHFYYYINHMPDFDQKRCEDLEPTIQGLPNDGRMHCAPTATCNILAYISTHGFPHIDPGVADWEMDMHYDTVSDFIDEVAVDMDTDPYNGTNYEDYYNEIVHRLECEFVVKLYIASGDYSPDFKGLCRSAINGHLILVRYGYYDDNGQTNSGRYKIDRDGGHLTTFSQGWGWEGTEILTVRDPATGGSDCYGQSDFSSRSWYVENRLVQNASGYNRTQSYLYEPGSDDNDYGDSRRYLDGYISIIPNRFYSWGEYDSGLRIIAPSDVILGNHVSPFIEVPENWDIRDYLPDPRSLRSLALIKRDNQHVLSELGPDSTMISNAMITQRLINPRHACWGSNGNLWVVDSGQLKVLQRVPGADDWSLDAVYDLQSPAESMASDPVNGGVYTMHPASQKMMYWPDPQSGEEPRDVGQPPEPKILPSDELSLNPATGELFIWSEATDSLWALEFVAGQNDMVATQQLIPDMETVTDVDIDDLGRVLVARNGKIAAYRRGEQGTWLHDNDHRFNGLEIGETNSMFTMLRSSTNARGDLAPSEMDNQPDEPQDGEASNEAVDCHADLNLDRTVDVTDLLALLSAWGNEGGLGDIVHDGRVDVLDLLELIEKWGQCD